MEVKIVSISMPKPILKLSLLQALRQNEFCLVSWPSWLSFPHMDRRKVKDSKLSNKEWMKNGENPKEPSQWSNKGAFTQIYSENTPKVAQRKIDKLARQA